MNTDEKAVYLTFDDGPVPEITPWVLDVLDDYGVKATFFMVGDNVQRHPQEYRMVRERGHRVGNHTFNHLRGLDYSSAYYLENTEKANALIGTDLFRPPHGFMRTMQYRTIHKRYRIIMWDVVTRDYSSLLTGEQVLGKVKRYTRSGSVITFHDSQKSWRTGNLQYALPRAIEWLLQEGYEFKIFN